MKKLYNITFILFLAALSCCTKEDPVIEDPVTQDQNPKIFINEVYSSGLSDWIEIFNPNSNTVDLSGFYIYDNPYDRYMLPVGTTVPPNAFLVIYCDNAGSGLHTNFNLLASGEPLWLANKEGMIVDHVSIPALQEGNSYGRKNDGEDNWFIFSTPSKGMTNNNNSIAGNQPPIFSNYTIEPISPGPVDNVTVHIFVIDESGIDSVLFFYKYINIDTHMLLPFNGCLPHDYYVNFPPLPASTLVEFYFKAVDDSAAVSYYPADALTNPLSYTVVP